MNKKVLIISTSFRKGGNSEKLSDEFMRGVKEAENEAEKIVLHDKKISFCKGCLTCQKTKRCVIDDDANMIAEKILVSDVIVFATPIYYYEMSGQMKTLLDRLNPLFTSDYKFRDIYLIATSAENEKSAMDGAIQGLQGFIKCYEKTKLEGVIYGTGADDIDISKNKAFDEAYKMGKSI